MPAAKDDAPVKVSDDEVSPEEQLARRRIQLDPLNLTASIEILAHAVQATVPAVPRTLDERMAAVQAELEDVPRRGHADVTTRAGGHYSYDYITEADLMAGIRPLLAKHGIAVYYSDELLGLTDGLARVRVNLRLRANGEERVLTSDGIGTDVGDKGPNKAKTSAMRYLLWKTFLQPADDDDPEQENVPAVDAAQAHQRAADTSRRRTGSGDRRGQLRERMNKLTVELDQALGQPPGKTLGDLPDLIADAYGGLLIDELTDAQLVEIGQQIGLHVQAAEQQGAEAGPLKLEAKRS